MSSFWQFFDIKWKFSGGSAIKLQTGRVTLTKFRLLLSGQLVPFYNILGCHGVRKCRGDPREMLPQSATESVAEKTFVFLQYCVPHLNGSITIDGRMSPKDCSHKILDTQSPGTTQEVTLAYTEAGGCQRRETYTVKMKSE